MPHEDRLLHQAVVLHPKSERRANITGTSPSYTAHVIVVKILLAIFSVSSGRPIVRKQSLMNRDFSDFERIEKIFFKKKKEDSKQRGFKKEDFLKEDKKRIEKKRIDKRGFKKD